MSDGSFFCIVPKVPPWYALLKRQHSEKLVEETLEPILTRYSASLQEQLSDTLIAAACGRADVSQSLDRNSSLSSSLPLPPQAAEAHRFVYSSGGIVYRPGVNCVVADGDIVHVSPYVQQDKDTERVAVFFGYLSNLSDLHPAGSAGLESTLSKGISRLSLSGATDRATAGGVLSPDSAAADSAANRYFHTGGSSTRSSACGSLDLNDDVMNLWRRRSGTPSRVFDAAATATTSTLVTGRSTATATANASSTPRAGDIVTAQSSAAGFGIAVEDNEGFAITSTLLRLYDKYGKGQEVVMLSELQGEFAFVIFDAARKYAIAARDPSGEEELYYAINQDGSAMFTNSLDDLPNELPSAGVQHNDWKELPPGCVCIVSGKKEPVVKQFALTREQLEERERMEEAGLDFDLD